LAEITQDLTCGAKYKTQKQNKSKNMVRAKSEVYDLVQGLRGETCVRLLNQLEELIQACHERKHCPKLAVLRVDDGSLPGTHLLLRTKREAYHRVTKLSIGDANGRHVQLVFQEYVPDNGEPANPRGLLTRVRIAGSKVIPVRQQILTPDFVEQFYAYAHYKLHGLCCKNRGFWIESISKP
jgi:hypothetical protein